jgi:alpha-beta hydrolase superfamily lysophospholipase
MIHEDIRLQASDGIELIGNRWLPDGPVKASVCLIHGLGEHTGRYQGVAEYLTSHGFALSGYDLHGHGKTQGPRGHYPSLERALDDIKESLDAIGRMDGKPVDFIYGHSMGGNLGLNYLMRRQPVLNGAVITSPGLVPYNKTPDALLAVGKILYKLVPTFALSNGLDRAYLSRDPEVIEKYNNDPLVHGVISARFGLDFISAGEWAYNHPELVNIPILIQVGTEDHLISYPVVKDFAQKVTGVTYKEWQGFYHETHNEPEKKQVLQVMVDWLDQRLAADA